MFNLLFFFSFTLSCVFAHDVSFKPAGQSLVPSSAIAATTREVTSSEPFILPDTTPLLFQWVMKKKRTPQPLPDTKRIPFLSNIKAIARAEPQRLIGLLISGHRVCEAAVAGYNALETEHPNIRVIDFDRIYTPEDDILCSVPFTTKVNDILLAPEKRKYYEELLSAGKGEMRHLEFLELEEDEFCQYFDHMRFLALYKGSSLFLEAGKALPSEIPHDSHTNFWPIIYMDLDTTLSGKIGEIRIHNPLGFSCYVRGRAEQPENSYMVFATKRNKVLIDTFKNIEEGLTLIPYYAYECSVVESYGLSNGRIKLQDITFTHPHISFDLTQKQNTSSWRKAAGDPFKEEDL